MTGEVLLREVTEDDLPVFFEHQRDPEANQMASFPARDREAFLAHWTKILVDETVTAKTILLDGRVAGNIVSFEQSGEKKVGYWIGRDYWGKGVASRALAAFLGYVDVRPLYAHVAKHNRGSIRVLEKCGFRISGEDQVSSDAGGDAVEELIYKLGSIESDEAP